VSDAAAALDAMRARLQALFADDRLRDLLVIGIRRDLFAPMFASLGGVGHTPWPPLSDETVRRRGSTPYPYLGDYSTEVMSGTLQRSLTEYDSPYGYAELRGNDTLAVGSTLEYAGYQERYGRPLIPEDVPEFTAEQWADLIGQWIAFGDLKPESF
jgi:hypothetical protein